MADHRLIATAGHALRRIAALHRLFTSRSEIVWNPETSHRVSTLNAEYIESYTTQHRLQHMSLETIRPYIPSDYQDRVFCINAEILEPYTGEPAQRIFATSLEYLHPAQQHLIYSANAEITESPDADHRIFGISAEYMRPWPDHRIFGISAELMRDGNDPENRHRIICIRAEYLVTITPSETTRNISISMH